MEDIALVITAIILTLLVLCFCSLFSVPYNFKMGSGQHVGYITAVDTQDNFFGHGTIVYFKTDLTATQEDEYCVNSNDELISQLKEYQKTKSNIEISYNNIWFTGWANCGGDIINKVSPITK